ncbi:MAG: hypothetical protein LPK90_02775 [Alphaproteobacteria bacterium]|jgi:hypothetical protein|nr:hypothetical protein [Alphaproteobacteria bacterium]MDX5492421.1 hypothetical protein [Alphaproteobacteria bacterium]
MLNEKSHGLMVAAHVPQGARQSVRIDAMARPECELIHPVLRLASIEMMQGA